MTSFVVVLEAGDGEHHEEGEDGELVEYSREDGEEPEDGDGEEDVGYLAELLEELAREEGEDSVLGGDDAFYSLHMLFENLSVLLRGAAVVVWEGVVDVDRAWGTGLLAVRERDLTLKSASLADHTSTLEDIVHDKPGVVLV